MRKKIIKYFIDKAKRNKLIQSIFEQPINLDNFSIKGSFVDSKGNTHSLYEGFRTKIKPGWERIFEQDGKTFNKSPERIRNIVQNGRIAVERIEPVIDLYTSGIKNIRILEIGCSAGGTSFAFAEKGAAEVIGTEFSEYKIESLDSGKSSQSNLKEVTNNLSELRELVRKHFKNTDKTSFIDDDICDSRLNRNYFDLICSWDVLEHLHNPLPAFHNMYQLLKEGGIAIHEYNPFFALNGGHSACTIDFPWGHVILNKEDFVKFNKEKQPEREDTSLSFYLNGINRMTIKDLKDYCKQAKLEILSLIEFPKEQHLRMIDKNILELAISNYSSLELSDLITPKIIAILRKPIT
jgi:SAM-dependent methyltransferase